MNPLDGVARVNEAPWHPVSTAGLAVASAFAACIAYFAWLGDGWVPLVDDANFAVHEAGHPLVGIFSARLAVYGGTLAQLLFPAVCMLEFWRRRATLSYALCGIWLGQSLLSVARYMADAQHLMTDVWTSAGVVVGVALVVLTGWLWLDPVIALAVAAHIVWAGVGIVRRSVVGLLDRALPETERRTIEAVLDRFRPQGIEFHALRTRAAAGRSFVSMHVLVPGAWSVQRGHDVVEEIEARVRDAVPSASVFTHIEPLEDPASYQDEPLDREQA